MRISETQRFFQDEDYGPPSKFAKMDSKHRKFWRRKLHKKNRKAFTERLNKGWADV